MAGCAVCLHKNVHPNVCSDCLGGTHFKPRIKTNADRIRAMSDEELAEWLGDTDACPPDVCTHIFDDVDCPECLLDWLRQEAEL